MLARNRLTTLAVAAATTLGTIGVAAAADAVVPGPIFEQRPQQQAANPLEGFYLGGHGGYGTANRCGEYDDDFPAWHDCDPGDSEYFNYDQKGWLLGAQAGVNHFIGDGPVVIGAEVTASLTGITGNLLTVPGGFDGAGDWTYLATATGKLGFAFNRRVMVYGEAGLALGGFRYNSTFCNFESNHQGWVAGGGIEAALKNNNSVFVEYNHIDFQGKDAQCGGGFFPVAIYTKAEVDVIRFGFNHFFR